MNISFWCNYINPTCRSRLRFRTTIHAKLAASSSSTPHKKSKAPEFTIAATMSSALESYFAGMACSSSNSMPLCSTTPLVVDNASTSQCPSSLREQSKSVQSSPRVACRWDSNSSESDSSITYCSSANSNKNVSNSYSRSSRWASINCEKNITGPSPATRSLDDAGGMVVLPTQLRTLPYEQSSSSNDESKDSTDLEIELDLGINLDELTMNPFRMKCQANINKGLEGRGTALPPKMPSRSNKAFDTHLPLLGPRII